MATGDKLVNLDDLKAVYDRLKAEDNALFTADRLIEFVEPDKTATGTQNYTSYSRAGNRITLNGKSDRTVYIRMYGNAAHGASSYDVAGNNPGCVTVTPGHTYALALRKVSGDYTATSSGTIAVVGYFKDTKTALGTAYNVINISGWQTHKFWQYIEFNVPADATSTQFGIWIYTTSGISSLSNLVLEVELYDVTDWNPFNDEAIAPSESVVAKANRAVGNLILLGGQLFKVSTAFSAGETITTSMITATSIADEIAALNT